jgi:hypothetical protein
MSSDLNINLIKLMFKYCNEIEELRIEFGDSSEFLSSDFAYKYSISMALL